MIFNVYYAERINVTPISLEKFEFKYDTLTVNISLQWTIECRRSVILCACELNQNVDRGELSVRSDIRDTVFFNSVRNFFYSLTYLDDNGAKLLLDLQYWFEERKQNW